MSYDIRGAFAAAALCATLAACGGDDSTPPTPVPATVTIQADPRAEAGAGERFATSASGTAGLSFHWDFGDGASADTPTASHAYAAPGDYQVVVAVSNAAQDVTTATWTVHVGHYAKLADANCSGNAAGEGWCWQNVQGSGNTINDVWFTDANHGWAVGGNATLIKTSDGGNTWTSVAVDPAVAGISLYSVRFADANNGIVSGGGGLNGYGSGGTILRTTDGGATWTASAIPSTTVPLGNQAHVLAWDGNTVVLGDGSSQAVSHDGGATWSAGPPGSAWWLVENGGDCWALNYQALASYPGCGNTAGSVLNIGSLSVAAGTSFITLAGLSFGSSTQAVALASAYTAASGYEEVVLTTGDRGATWSTAVLSGLPTNGGLTNLRMADATHGWVIAPYYYCCAANMSPFYATADGGQTWSQVSLPVALPGTYDGRPSGLVDGAYWTSSANTIAVTGDFGATWQTATLGPEAGSAVSLVHWFDANDFVVSTQAASGRFYATHDGGRTWIRILGPDPRDANASAVSIAFADANHGAFLSSRGELMTTTDGGVTWNRQDYATSAAQPVSLRFVSPTEAWMLLSGRLAHSTDGGASWTIPLLASRLMSGVAGMQWQDAKHAWVWGTDNSTYRCYLASTADGGATWTDAALPTADCIASAVFPDASNGVVLTAFNGVPYVTADGGKTWTVSAQASSLGLGGTLQPGAGARDVWLLGGNTLAHSTDGGKTWEVAVGASGSFNALHFADATHGWAVGNYGALFATVDGGRTWAAQDSGTTQSLLAVGASDGMTAWVVTANGQVLATATGGF
jgi:photosystem II stability/assembly factor-like uncharacterized protein